MTKVFAVITWVIILLTSGIVQAKTFDVGSVSKFRAALNEAGHGDVILLAPGDYRLQVEPKRDGVTIRGAPGYKSRILLPDSTSGGRQIFGIKQNDITLEYLVIDGEKKGNSGHGLIRVGNAKNLKIRWNKIKDSGSAHISLGGSWKNSTIKNVEIIGNELSGSGYQGEYGESLYFGDYQGSGSVDGVIVAGNIIEKFTDNAIDCKPPCRNVRIYYNYIHDQEDRVGKEINTGTLVVQGRNVDVRNNYIRNVLPGKAVFNLASNAGVILEENVVETVRKADTLVRKRADGSGGKTEIKNNLFCDTSGTKIQNVSGMSMANNRVEGSKQDCAEAGKVILAAMKQYQPGEVPPEPVPPVPPAPPEPDLPALMVDSITYGQTCDHCVRVYVKTVEAGVDPQMDKREYHGPVTFWRLDGFPLEWSGQRPAKAIYPAGWSFLLREPYPRDEAIKMVASAGWIDGGPEINQTILRHGMETPKPDPEPEPPPEPEPGPDPKPGRPLYQMVPGESAICTTRAEINIQFGGTGVRVDCMSPQEAQQEAAEEAEMMRVMQRPMQQEPEKALTLPPPDDGMDTITITLPRSRRNMTIELRE